MSQLWISLAFIKRDLDSLPCVYSIFITWCTVHAAIIISEFNHQFTHVSSSTAATVIMPFDILSCFCKVSHFFLQRKLNTWEEGTTFTAFIINRHCVIITESNFSRIPFFSVRCHTFSLVFTVEYWILYNFTIDLVHRVRRLQTSELEWFFIDPLFSQEILWISKVIETVQI